MKLRILCALAAVSLLSACADKPDSSAANTGAGGASSQSGGMSGTATPGSEEDLVANVGDRVMFGTNESALSPDAQGVLGRQADWLQRYPQVQVQLAGNCDDRGTEEFNLALGQRRANAARDFLVAHGVSSGRVSTISYGKDRPTALGDDEGAWAQNRNAITSVR